MGNVNTHVAISIVFIVLVGCLKHFYKTIQKLIIYLIGNSRQEMRIGNLNVNKKVQSKN